MRCGDVVIHKPSGEQWVVAYQDGDRLSWIGWPEEGEARASDCDVVVAASDDEHRAAVKLFEGSSGPRARKVLALYGEVVR